MKKENNKQWLKNRIRIVKNALEVTDPSNFVIYKEMQKELNKLETLQKKYNEKGMQ